jgi:hypothetical protein
MAKRSERAGPRRPGEPRQGHPGPRVRILPHPVRQRRGQERWPVLHPVLRGALPGCHARALQGPHLRSLLRLGRHVRAVGKVRRSPRRQAGRHQHLRPGEQRHHPPPGRDEPRPARHRSRLRARASRHLPSRSAPRLARRLRPGQSALQRLGLVPQRRRRALAVRHPAQGQRQLRLGLALHPPPGTQRHGWLRSRQRQHVVQPIRRRRHPQSHHRGGSRGLHGRHARPALLQHADRRCHSAARVHGHHHRRPGHRRVHRRWCRSRTSASWTTGSSPRCAA